MTRTAVGPFSLNTNESLDAKIVAFFETARSRGKSDLFREAMAAFFSQAEQSVTNEITERLDRILSIVESGVIVSTTDEKNLDSLMSKNDDPLVIEAELALDKLAML